MKRLTSLFQYTNRTIPSEKGAGTILFVSVLIGLVMVGATYNLSRTSDETLKLTQKEGTVFASNVIKTSIEGYLRDGVSISVSQDDAANSKFKTCMTGSPSSCARDEKGFFLLKDRADKIIYRPTISADPDVNGWSEQGFNLEGKSCNNPGTVQCPFQVKIEWFMDCDAGAPTDPCINPGPRFSFQLKASAPKSEFAINANKMDFAVGTSKDEQKNTEQVCQDIGGEFNSKDNKCEFEFLSKYSNACQADQFIKSIKPDGSPVCESLSLTRCPSGKRIVTGIEVKKDKDGKVIGEEFKCM